VPSSRSRRWASAPSQHQALSQLTAAGRNDVRALYGGFGVMLAAVLLVAVHESSLRAGILVTVASALGGMAAGRLISAAVDRGIDAGPVRYLVLEVVVAIMLLAAVEVTRRSRPVMRVMAKLKGDA
jgi:hypothetical protein